GRLVAAVRPGRFGAEREEAAAVAVGEARRETAAERAGGEALPAAEDEELLAPDVLDDARARHERRAEELEGGAAGGVEQLAFVANFGGHLILHARRREVDELHRDEPGRPDPADGTGDDLLRSDGREDVGEAFQCLRVLAA